MDIKKSLKDVLVLFVICSVFGTLLALVNFITAPIIRANDSAAADAALLEVLPDGKNFKEIEITDKYPTVVDKGWKADGGYVFQMTVEGWSSGLVIMVGVDTEGKVAGVKHLQTNETYGLESQLNQVYLGDTLETLEFINVTSGATSLSSSGYFKAVDAALKSAAVANGENVETKTPEEILQANCNTALGTTDLVFTRWFATEIITGVDKVYEAADGAGYVFIIGESFVGVNESGVTTPDASEENKATASEAYDTVTASALTEITELPNGINKNIVKKAYITLTGNYVFELEGSGYADYGASYGGGRAPIYISVSISPDGKIIDCVTTYHTESKGYGDKCATDEYRDGWVGKEGTDIVVSGKPVNSTDLGAIAGATYTTHGYQKAVKAAFAAFELLTEGGNE